MYQIGDLILYGGTGVCKVLDIIVQDAAGDQTEQLFYVLEPLYQSCTIFAPVHKTKVFMRPIISKDEAKQLMGAIPTLCVEACHSRGTNELTTYYKGALSTHDCSALLGLTMSIYEKKRQLEQQKRKLGAIDERFMKRGEELLFGELSAALDIPRETVAEYIAKSVAERQPANHASPAANDKT